MLWIRNCASGLCVSGQILLDLAVRSSVSVGPIHKYKGQETSHVNNSRSRVNSIGSPCRPSVRCAWCVSMCVAEGSPALTPWCLRKGPVMYKIGVQTKCTHGLLLDVLERVYHTVIVYFSRVRTQHDHLHPGCGRLSGAVAVV